VISAQQYPPARIHAHNDYLQPVPFFDAYNAGVGSIEADIFLVNGTLVVAHTAEEIMPENTLEKLYLRPLQDMIGKNKGLSYPLQQRSLMLLIDLKTAGSPTLDALVSLLKKYPAITACKTLELTISGEVPDTTLWNRYPGYIHFDGRPTRQYTQAHLKRVNLISDSFANYSTWKGDTILSVADSRKIKEAVERVHRQGKKIRFWATADKPPVWSMLMEMQVDVIGTDHVPELVKFITR
jgi:alkaline phosphatase